MRCILVFFLDAVRYDYLNERDTPFLMTLAKKGIFAPLKTILGFTGIAVTIFTGTYPDTHGIWTEYIAPSYPSQRLGWLKPLGHYLQAIDSTFTSDSLGWVRKVIRLGISSLIWFRSKVSGESFITNPLLNEIPMDILPKLDLSLKKSIYECNSFGNIKSLFGVLRQSGITFFVIEYPFFRPDLRVFKRALQLAKQRDLCLVLVRLSGLDGITHRYGTNSTQRVEELRRTDSYVKQITSEFSRHGRKCNVIVFADHGMVDISCKVNIVAAMKKSRLDLVGKHHFAFLDSTLARFWAEEPILSRIVEILSDIQGGKVLGKEDFKTLHVPDGQPYGDLIFLANPGVLISPNFYQGNRSVASMHGYDPSVKEQDSIFILSGVGSEGVTLDKVNLVDIMPTILKLMELSPTEFCIGKSVVP